MSSSPTKTNQELLILCKDSTKFHLFVFSFREIEELREQKLVLDLQVEELQTRVHSLSSSLKQKDQEVEVSLLQGRIPSSRSPCCGLESLKGAVLD